IAGTFPGLFLGMIIRILYLPDPRLFKLFAGLVLLYIGGRMVYQLIADRGSESAAKIAEDKMRQEAVIRPESDGPSRSKSLAICTISWSLKRTEYEFFGQCFSFHTTGLFILSLVVGLIGGIYGIGGGAIIAPFIVTFFNLPVHTIAGATLMGTCVTSIGGVIFYPLIGP